MAYQNYFSSKISNDIGAGDTSITVDNAPTATSGRMALEARNPTQREIIKYTSVAGNTLTGVSRAQGGTTAKSHLKGALIQMNATAEDLQDLYDGFNSFSATNNDWRTLAPAVSSVVDNGNRSYDITFASTVAAILSPGMRLRTERTTASPTQCTLLNGSTQYYSKASPNKLTFTDDFVVSAWIKLSSYPAATFVGGIASRTDNTNGWTFWINEYGQVVINGRNGAITNYSRITSYQSVPLNKWVHVAAQLDMSTFTATTTTSYIMIDGVDVPGAIIRGGTNPTALVQAGNLEIGRTDVGNSYCFPGKIAQVAIYNAKVTQAVIKASMNQTLTGSETSLASAYSFNNAITDLNTSTPNDLTANGSAVATEADSFAGGQADGTISSVYDYAIVTKVNGTVVTVQAAEGCTIPTSGGVSAVSYSTQKAPYGFPSQDAKWEVLFLARGTQAPASGTTNNTWYNPSSYQLNVPIGEWVVRYSTPIQANNNTAGSTVVIGSLSTSTSTDTDPRFTISGEGSSVVSHGFQAMGEASISASSATPYYALAKASVSGTVTFIGFRTENSTATITATCAYL